MKKPEVAVAGETSARVSAGAACTLRVEADGTPLLHYFWYRDSVLLDSQNADSLVLPAVASTDAGLYYCKVTNMWGEAVSDTITVVITYTLTYNGNGSDSGSIPVDTNRYFEGATVKVSGNVGNLTKTGCTFSGWTGRVG